MYKYDPHFPIRLVQRRLSLSEVLDCLGDPDRLVEVKPYLVNNRDDEFRLFFRLSGKFMLIVGVRKTNKHLYIKTVIKSNKKWKVPVLRQKK